MTIVSACNAHIDDAFGDFAQTEFTLRAMPHVNSYGHEVTNNLYVVRYVVTERLFVTYEFDDKSVLRIMDHMDRKTWHRVWGEFRKLSHDRTRKLS